MPTRVKDDFVSDNMLKLAIVLEEFNRLLTDDEILKLKEVVRVGIESEIPLINYNDLLFTLSCIVDAVDMKSPSRDVSTVFKQGISNKHPCGVPLSNVVQMSVNEHRKHRGELQHTLQIHKYCNYCLRDGVGRFGFPLPLVEKKHIMIEGKLCRKTT